MCGIAGVFDHAGGDPEVFLSSLLAAIAHRGVSLYETSGGDDWAIGANRLPIVGRSSGRQPLFSEDGTIGAVLNGEIYNHQSLRCELEKEGCRFSSDVDTEVLAHGYQKWGDALFARLDGMFAAILVDKRDGTHVAVRDSLGVKPLYRVANADGVFYASEIKALRACSGQIEAVPPGHSWHSRRGVRLVSRDGEQRQRGQLNGTLSQHAVDLRRLLEHSVSKRVATDLPVAVFLSGGIDSSAVMYEAAKAHPDVVAFSIGALDSPDVVSANRICRELGWRHRHISVTAAELLDLVPEVVRTIESFEPNHIRGGTLSYVLSREVARAGYRIALCGEGADELFAGYPEVSAAIASSLPEKAVEAVLERFVGELDRTQLQRVDRTSMRFALEMREPFLDQDLVAFARRLPLSHKVAATSSGISNKRVLREAYRDVLPDWLVAREKAVFSLGAGFGSNGAEGVFYQHAKEQVDEARLAQLQQRFPQFHLRNHEEAYYFSLFNEYFGPLSLAADRPLVNASKAVPQS